MNLILFTPAETHFPLSKTDARAEHILKVLRRQILDTFDVGLVNGPRGKATLVGVDASSLRLEFAWGDPPPPLPEIHCLIGLPRPQTARKILFEATSLGVRSLHFFQSARGEPSYVQSSLWTSGEWERHLVAGAEQAFCTQLPTVTWTHSLPEAIAALPAGAARLALDNYEASIPLGHAPLALPVGLALGAERGWSPAERTVLRKERFTLAHLGPRVLRAETALTASLAICASRLGLH